MASTKKKLRLRKKNVPKDGSSKISQTMSAEASPDSKCPICLDRFNNMAYLDRCLHKFCFRCIHEWSKNKAECPLCKQPFNSIFHTIKAENDFKEFILRPTENGSFGSLDGHRFRYRTTMTRRTSPPPDNGILFEGPTGNAPPQRNRGVQRMMLRLAARRRAQTEGRSVRLMQEQEMISFRRALYRTGVRVRNVHDGGRYRDISAEFFRRNPACLHRLVPWLKRELTVLYGAHGSLVNIVQHIIMTRITRCDMEDQAIQNELKPFLLTRTEHFLHEFISFARAPYNMDAYDQHAVYDCPAPSYEEGSSSELSVITISADEADTEEDQGMVSMAGSGLSQAPWDDETPGPSYSATEQVQPATFSVSESESETSGDEEGQVMPSVQESAEVKTDPSANEGADVSSTDEDCVIVGFVKPLAERTPELVQLSSDSEESVHNESTDVPAQPQHLRFPSISSPPSSVCSVVSKDKSPHGHEKSNKKETSKGKDQSISRGTDTSKTYSKGMHAHDDKRHHRRDRSRSKERSRQNKKRRSKSTEKSWSIRSTTTSLNSDSTLSRGRRQSRSRSRDYPPSRDMGWQRSRDNDKSYSRHSHEKSYSYYWDSYSHYSRDRGSNDSVYMQNRSYSASYYVSPEHRARSHSNSRSNRSSSSHRDYHHRERRRSRSLSSSSSRASHSAHRRSRHDKPSGKRKYKTRHLEGTSKEVTSKSYASSSNSLPEKRGSSERYHKKSRKKSRSLSVEIVYEGKATGESSRRHKKHKKHKKKCKRHRSREKAGHRAPTVITIDSDSDHAMEASDHVRETSDQAEKENVHAGDESDHAENESDHAENESDHAENESDHAENESDHAENESDHAEHGSDHARETRDYTGNASDQAAEASDQTGNTSDQSDSSNENAISSTTGSLADTNVHESHVLAEHSASAISEDDVLTKAREATDTGDTIKSVSWQTSLALSDESSTGTGSPSNSQETRLEEQSSVENSPQKTNCISKPFNTGPHAGICK